MNHYPVFLDLSDRHVVLCGNGEMALAKLRLLIRTPAHLTLFAPQPEAKLVSLASANGATVHNRLPTDSDLVGATLVYTAFGDSTDQDIARMARASGQLVNIVDDLAESDFITPAIVERTPLTVAIGTEGAAPVLARAIKADLEARLPQSLGILARTGKKFRDQAEALPQGRQRRDFWDDFYFKAGPGALAQFGEASLENILQDLLERHLAQAPRPGRVDLVGAGPGDPELMTLRARRLLDAADVVIHDGLVPQAILDLARREAVFVAVGKEGFGPSTPQEIINAEMIEHARTGAQVVRLKAGDPSVFARLDEETEALDAAGIDWAVVPGITAASAAAAALGTSLTRRARNSDLRILTAHDLDGFAEHDWRALAQRDVVAAIYMGRRAARFMHGRLLMHGADRATPISIVENASRPEQRIIASHLDNLVADLDAAALTGPTVLMLGLTPARAKDVVPGIARREKELA